MEVIIVTWFPVGISAACAFNSRYKTTGPAHWQETWKRWLGPNSLQLCLIPQIGPKIWNW